MKLFAVLTVVSSFALANAAKVPVEVCENITDKSVLLTDVDVSEVLLGESITILYRLNTTKVLSKPTLNFEMTNNGLKIPCTKSTGFGSCTYSLCGKVSMNVEESMCKPWSCKCPIQPGSYADSKGLVFPIPKFDGILGSFIVNGPTKLKMKVIDGGKTLSCGTFSLQVKSKDKKLKGLFGRQDCAVDHD